MTLGYGVVGYLSWVVPVSFLQNPKRWGLLLFATQHGLAASFMQVRESCLYLVDDDGCIEEVLKGRSHFIT
jgi:hypothetical protein